AHRPSTLIPRKSFRHPIDRRFPGGQSPRGYYPVPEVQGMRPGDLSDPSLDIFGIHSGLLSAGRVAVCSGPSLDYRDLGVTIPDRLNRTSSDPDTPRESSSELVQPDAAQKQRPS